MLSLLYDFLKRELLKPSCIVKTDDSSIKVQDRKHKNNIRKGKITTYIGDASHRVIVFDYSPHLSFERNIDFLEEEFCGIVQLDAAGGFDALFTDEKRTELGAALTPGEHILKLSSPTAPHATSFSTSTEICTRLSEK